MDRIKKDFLVGDITGVDGPKQLTLTVCHHEIMSHLACQGVLLRCTGWVNLGVNHT